MGSYKVLTGRISCVEGGFYVVVAYCIVVRELGSVYAFIKIPNLPYVVESLVFIASGLMVSVITSTNRGIERHLLVSEFG